MERTLAKTTVHRHLCTGEQLLLLISGEAGTGKTSLLREIRALILQTNPRAVIQTVAPTGLSAYIIGGKTIHSAFGIQNDQQARTYAPRAFINSRIDWLIVDEISMVSREIFYAIEFSVRLMRGMRSKHVPFGGASVILFGDLLQLQPVEGNKIFCRDFSVSEYILGRRSDELNSQSIGWHGASTSIAPQNGDVKIIPNLWQCFDYIELKRNFRHADDEVLAALLSQLRKGSIARRVQPLNLKPLEARRLCSAEIVDQLPRFDQAKNADEMVIHLFTTRKGAKTFNNSVLRQSCNSGRCNGLVPCEACENSDNVLVSKAEDTVTFLNEDASDAENNDDDDDEGRRRSHANNEKLKKFKQTGIPNTLCGLQKCVKLVKGACVMLTANLNVEKGLVNGRIGKLTRVKPFVVVRFDDFFCRENAHHEVINRMRATYFNFDLYAKVNRTQYPLTNGPAFTIHRVQGVTLKQPVVLHFSPLFCSSLAYTAISRVQRLSDLAVADRHVSIINENFPPKDALDEIERLRAKEIKVPNHIQRNIYC